jgi:hypothetical protein
MEANGNQTEAKRKPEVFKSLKINNKILFPLKTQNNE